ncbi:acyltransferase [Saccharopolyspora sp. TS4A08]|uniref:Acyltransferase n=1 Tax=Saccharopolyspora ipomoeae TaxID=3042027 RepID=A0ABT6PXG6_9PSEU|nr:acyltransferase [Saccharopolyspora sp. TS4A08]MDI2032714.1 acyltransferase [Saccharopolyspora sp. TS4A08]
MSAARVVHARPELFAAPNHGFAWIRMIGALLVIYGHSSPLVGSGELFPPEWPVQPDEGVLMGFFALSGFQITESWMRDPHALRFAVKRVLRLWPPMLTVSVGMALVVGPMITTLPLGEYFRAHETWGYIVNNAGLLTLRHDLPGVFESNPWPDAVNGSLWTLPMELLAYGGLFALLLLGTARKNLRWLTVLALIGLVAWDRHLEQIPGAESAGSLLSVPVESLVAFLVAFAAGVLLNLYRIPLSPLAAGAGLVVLVVMGNTITASAWMAFAVSYAVIVAGHFWPAKLTVPGVWVNGSYGVYVWGFPVQQLLALAGLRNQWLMLLCAAPIAYVLGTLSWKYVEDPTMRLRHLLTPTPTTPPDPSDAPTEVLHPEPAPRAPSRPQGDEVFMKTSPPPPPERDRSSGEVFMKTSSPSGPRPRGERPPRTSPPAGNGVPSDVPGTSTPSPGDRGGGEVFMRTSPVPRRPAPRRMPEQSPLSRRLSGEIDEPEEPPRGRHARPPEPGRHGDPTRLDRR